MSELYKNYLEWLKQQENAEMKGFKNGKFYPYLAVERSSEGVSTDFKSGKFDIGYGIKIHTKEQYDAYSKGLDEAQMNSLLEKEVMKSFEDAQKYVDNHYPGKWETLPDEAKFMLTDYDFNLGSVNKFPKMVEGLVNGDFEKVKNEYQRKSNGKPIKKRNEGTEAFFIKKLDLLKFVPPVQGKINKLTQDLNN